MSPPAVLARAAEAAEAAEAALPTTSMALLTSPRATPDASACTSTAAHNSSHEVAGSMEHGSQLNEAEEHEEPSFFCATQHEGELVVMSNMEEVVEDYSLEEWSRLLNPGTSLAEYTKAKRWEALQQLVAPPLRSTAHSQWQSQQRAAAVEALAEDAHSWAEQVYGSLVQIARQRLNAVEQQRADIDIDIELTNQGTLPHGTEAGSGPEGLAVGAGVSVAGAGRVPQPALGSVEVLRESLALTWTRLLALAGVIQPSTVLSPTQLTDHLRQQQQQGPGFDTGLAHSTPSKALADFVVALADLWQESQEPALRRQRRQLWLIARSLLPQTQLQQPEGKPQQKLQHNWQEQLEKRQARLLLLTAKQAWQGQVAVRNVASLQPTLEDVLDGRYRLGVAALAEMPELEPEPEPLPGDATAMEESADSSESSSAVENSDVAGNDMASEDLSDSDDDASQVLEDNSESSDRDSDWLVDDCVSDLTAEQLLNEQLRLQQLAPEGFGALMTRAVPEPSSAHSHFGAPTVIVRKNRKTTSVPSGAVQAQQDRASHADEAGRGGANAGSATGVDVAAAAGQEVKGPESEAEEGGGGYEGGRGHGSSLGREEGGERPSGDEPEEDVLATESGVLLGENGARSMEQEAAGGEEEQRKEREEAEEQEDEEVDKVERVDGRKGGGASDRRGQPPGWSRFTPGQEGVMAGDDMAVGQCSRHADQGGGGGVKESMEVGGEEVDGEEDEQEAEDGDVDEATEEEEGEEKEEEEEEEEEKEALKAALEKDQAKQERRQRHLLEQQTRHDQGQATPAALVAGKCLFPDRPTPLISPHFNKLMQHQSTKASSSAGDRASRLSEAARAYLKPKWGQPQPSIAALAQQFSVPYATLQGVIKRGGVVAKRGRPIVLSAVAEQQLRDMVVGAQQQGVGVTKTALLAAVKRTVKATARKGEADPFQGKAPGEKWRRGFMRRQGLALRKATPVTKNRRQAAANPGRSITCVAWGSADGQVMPPNFVYAGKQLSHNALGATHFYHRSAIIVKEGTHMMDGRLFPKLLDVMAAQIPGGVSPTKRALLVLDGHASRFSAETKEAARRHGFDLLVLPAQCTSFLQPWDQLFSSVKAVYQRLLGQAAYEAGVNGFNPAPSQIISLVDTAVHYSVGFSCEPLQRALLKTGLHPPSKETMLAAAAASMVGGKQQAAFKPWTSMNLTTDMLDAAVQRSAILQPSLRFPAEDRFYFKHEVVARAAKKAVKKSKAIPAGCSPDARPLQVEGLQFLWTALVTDYESAGTEAEAAGNGGVILAHTMGLGKTLTTICFLHTFFAHHPTGRALVVVPANVSRAPGLRGQGSDCEHERGKGSAQQGEGQNVLVMSPCPGLLHQVLVNFYDELLQWLPPTPHGASEPGLTKDKVFMADTPHVSGSASTKFKDTVQPDWKPSGRSSKTTKAAQDRLLASQKSMQSGQDAAAGAAEAAGAGVGRNGSGTPQQPRAAVVGGPTTPETTVQQTPVQQEAKASSSPQSSLKSDANEELVRMLLEGPSIVVADEAHEMKNPSTKVRERAAGQCGWQGGEGQDCPCQLLWLLLVWCVLQFCQAMCLVKTPRRIALTGYPLQNSLDEYYVMICWVKPNYLGEPKDFKEEFVDVIEAGRRPNASQKQKTAMRVHLVALDESTKGCVQAFSSEMLHKILLDRGVHKTEHVLMLQMNEMQHTLYQAYLKALAEYSVSRNLLRDYAFLQQVCNTPQSLHYDLVTAGGSAGGRQALGGAEEVLPEEGAQGDGEEEAAVVLTGASSFLPSDLADFVRTEEAVLEAEREGTYVGGKKQKKKTAHQNGKEQKKKPAKAKQGQTKEFTLPAGVVCSLLRTLKQLRQQHQQQAAGGERGPGSSHKSCCLPALLSAWSEGSIPGKGESMWTNVPKLQFLQGLLLECKEEGEKMVVFSQTLGVLDAVCNLLCQPCLNLAEKRSWFRIHGETPPVSRMEHINAFQATKGFAVMVVSTRAGAVGINLTSARRLVVFDVPWNPVHNAQAVARIHRMGQTRPTLVYRLVYKGTMEEHNYVLSVRKEELFQRVIDGKPVQFKGGQGGAPAEFYDYRQAGLMKTSALSAQLGSCDPLLRKLLLRPSPTALSAAGRTAKQVAEQGTLLLPLSHSALAPLLCGYHEHKSMLPEDPLQVRKGALAMLLLCGARLKAMNAKMRSSALKMYRSKGEARGKATGAFKRLCRMDSVQPQHVREGGDIRRLGRRLRLRLGAGLRLPSQIPRQQQVLAVTQGQAGLPLLLRAQAPAQMITASVTRARRSSNGARHGASMLAAAARALFKYKRGAARPSAGASAASAKAAALIEVDSELEDQFEAELEDYDVQRAPWTPHLSSQLPPSRRQTPLNGQPSTSPKAGSGEAAGQSGLHASFDAAATPLSDPGPDPGPNPGPDPGPNPGPGLGTGPAPPSDIGGDTLPRPGTGPSGFAAGPLRWPVFTPLHTFPPGLDTAVAPASAPTPSPPPACAPAAASAATTPAVSQQVGASLPSKPLLPFTLPPAAAAAAALAPAPAPAPGAAPARALAPAPTPAHAPAPAGTAAAVGSGAGCVMAFAAGGSQSDSPTLSSAWLPGPDTRIMEAQLARAAAVAAAAGVAGAAAGGLDEAASLSQASQGQGGVGQGHASAGGVRAAAGCSGAAAAAVARMGQAVDLNPHTPKGQQHGASSHHAATLAAAAAAAAAASAVSVAASARGKGAGQAAAAAAEEQCTAATRLQALAAELEAFLRSRNGTSTAAVATAAEEMGPGVGVIGAAAVGSDARGSSTSTSGSGAAAPWRRLVKPRSTSANPLEPVVHEHHVCAAQCEIDIDECHEAAAGVPAAAGEAATAAAGEAATAVVAAAAAGEAAAVATGGYPSPPTLAPTASTEETLLARPQNAAADGIADEGRSRKRNKRSPARERDVDGGAAPNSAEKRPRRAEDVGIGAAVRSEGDIGGEANEPEVAAVADGALRELELKWEASAQQVAGQGAPGEREQQGRDVEERLLEEMRAAEQAERQLEAHQRRGGRQPVAQPAPRADTVDQLAVGVIAGQPCAKVWKELLDPTLRREHVIVAWRVLHASLMVGALWGHILIAWEWVLDVYGLLTGTRPPLGDAMLLLSGRPTRGKAPPFQPPDSLLWLRLRVAYMGAVWRLRSSGAATALQPQQVARRVVEEVISTLTTADKRDWHRVGRDIRVGLCGAMPSTWFKEKDPELDAAHFDQLWPEAMGAWEKAAAAARALLVRQLVRVEREGEAEAGASAASAKAAALIEVDSELEDQFEAELEDYDVQRAPWTPHLSSQLPPSRRQTPLNGQPSTSPKAGSGEAAGQSGLHASFDAAATPLSDPGPDPGPNPGPDPGPNPGPGLGTGPAPPSDIGGDTLPRPGTGPSGFAAGPLRWPVFTPLHTFPPGLDTAVAPASAPTPSPPPACAPAAASAATTPAVSQQVGASLPSKPLLPFTLPPAAAAAAALAPAPAPAPGAAPAPALAPAPTPAHAPAPAGTAAAVGSGAGCVMAFAAGGSQSDSPTLSSAWLPGPDTRIMEAQLARAAAVAAAAGVAGAAAGGLDEAASLSQASQGQGGVGQGHASAGGVRAAAGCSGAAAAAVARMGQAVDLNPHTPEGQQHGASSHHAATLAAAAAAAAAASAVSVAASARGKGAGQAAAAAAEEQCIAATRLQALAAELVAFLRSRNGTSTAAVATAAEEMGAGVGVVGAAAVGSDARGSSTSTSGSGAAAPWVTDAQVMRNEHRLLAILQRRLVKPRSTSANPLEPVVHEHHVCAAQCEIDIDECHEAAGGVPAAVGEAATAAAGEAATAVVAAAAAGEAAAVATGGYPSPPTLAPAASTEETLLARPQSAAADGIADEGRSRKRNKRSPARERDIDGCAAPNSAEKRPRRAEDVGIGAAVRSEGDIGGEGVDCFPHLVNQQRERVVNGAAMHLGSESPVVTASGETPVAGAKARRRRSHAHYTRMSNDRSADHDVIDLTQNDE
ncbi:hypothetical protein QJQ45_022678 [Haematococcus lacustris]|nr:hypothetical protein QJQ45_022678 [Haematococcus lacustris]